MDILRRAMVTNRYQLHVENEIMEAAAEQRKVRTQRNSEGSPALGQTETHVRFVQSCGKMVKVSTEGISEVEMRALFELMGNQTCNDVGGFLQNVTQNKTMCRLKIPLGAMDSKNFRVAEGHFDLYQNHPVCAHSDWRSIHGQVRGNVDEDSQQLPFPVAT